MTYWATNTATIWTVNKNDFGEPTFGAPYTIAATWKDVGDLQTDDNGDQFVPNSTFYTMSLLERGWYIGKGDLTGTASPITAKAQKIRKVVEFDMSQFSKPTEYAVMT